MKISAHSAHRQPAAQSRNPLQQVESAYMASNSARNSPQKSIWAKIKQPDTLIKPTMRYPLARTIPEPATDWSPFYSSLIDTVAVLIELNHKPLRKIAEASPNVRKKGQYQLAVSSPLSAKICARVFSRDDRTRLLIEASIPKFLTGQNIVGVEELFEPCQQMIFSVLAQMGVEPTAAERHKLEHGKFQMTRVDYATHCDCAAPQRATAVMAAIRSLVFAKAKDASSYGNETVYVNQHSTRWTLRIYRKDLEIQKRGRGLPLCVYGREYLLNKVQNAVRMELVLRSPELKRLGLNDPLAWSVDRARQRMKKWIDRFANATGVMPSTDYTDLLSNMQQLKLQAWLRGNLTAFIGSPTTFDSTHKLILEKTGIDIRGEPDVELQRRAIMSIRDVFEQGICFKSYERKWDALCNGSTVVA
ncbi:phage/plasmid replication protein, II/X family [Comamonas aquatica]|uniref:phage/plasmid replication protein, II/X family n=1 Tax=Comamonas aquatica TaxID=225991 RepID=UPI00244871EF|nr:phage/plasmid replication protein, II/X family [Comamonas aquatica]MDH0373511.1 phage/plasmid replication protein, II/X family [Comamonas aquatica]